MLSNAIRGHMAEFGLISAKGRNGTAELLKIIANARRTIGFQKLRRSVSMFSLVTSHRRQRSQPSRSASMLGIARVKRAGGSRRSHWPACRHRPGCRGRRLEGVLIRDFDQITDLAMYSAL
jgi:hypothetical protein